MATGASEELALPSTFYDSPRDITNAMCQQSDLASAIYEDDAATVADLTPAGGKREIQIPEAGAEGLIYMSNEATGFPTSVSHDDAVAGLGSRALDPRVSHQLQSSNANVRSRSAGIRARASQLPEQRQSSGAAGMLSTQGQIANYRRYEGPPVRPETQEVTEAKARFAQAELPRARGVKAVFPNADLEDPDSKDGPEFMQGNALEGCHPADIAACRNAFLGASGSSTSDIQRRLQAENPAAGAPRQKLLRLGDSSIDDMLCGRDLDGGDADDHLEDQLYSGFGTRSKYASNPYDMAGRGQHHVTEEQLWGVSILGGALVDKPPTDPRFQDDARFNLPGSDGAVDDTAGASTAHIGTMAAKTYDVTMRPKGVGSAVINPTEADQIIFGYDADGSGDVVRDWGGAAGAGSAYKPDQCGVSGSNQAALHLRAQSDISQVQHRKRIGSASAMALADGVDDGSGGAEGEGGAGLYSRSRLAQASQGRQVGRVTPGSGATRLTHRAAVGGAGVDHRGRAGKLMSSAVGIDRRLPSEPKSAPMCELKADGRRRMPRDMVSDPFESAAAAQMRNAAEAGVEAHNISSAQRIIMQQPEDVGGQQAQLMRQREKYGDAVGLSSEQVARARGEGDIHGASPVQLGARAKDPGAAGGPSSFEVAKAKSRKQTGACACNAADINDDTHDFDYPKRQAQQQQRLRQQKQPQGAGRTTACTNLQRTYDPSNAQQKQQRPAAGGRVRMPMGHGHAQGQLGATVFGYEIVPTGEKLGWQPALDTAGAGKGSSLLQESQQHKVWGNEQNGLRKMSMRKNSGDVDMVVFGHDIDMSEHAEDLNDSHHFLGAHGLFASQLAHKSMANDSTSRMHMDNVKSTKSSGFQAEDGQVKEAVFGVWGRDVIDAQQRVPRSTVPAFEGAAGGSSNFINYHQNHPTVKGQNKFFEALKAGEDAVSGSKDVLKFESGYFDPNSLTPQQQAAMRAATHATEGVAGISTFATVMNEEIAQRPDHSRRLRTPHQQEEMYAFICPTNEYLSSYHAAARASHTEAVDEFGVAGTRAHRISSNAEQRGTPPRRKISLPGGGHGREIAGGTLSVSRGLEAHAAAADRADRAAPADRPAGSRYSVTAPSNRQMRRPSHPNQQALLAGTGAPAAGTPSNRPRSAPATSAQKLLRNERDGAYEAYERALEEGRAMLASPYSAPGQTPDTGHGGCGSYGGYGGSHGGNYVSSSGVGGAAAAGGFCGSAAAPRGLEDVLKNPKGRVRNPISETTAKTESVDEARERFQTVTAGHYGPRSTVGSSPYCAGSTMVVVGGTSKAKPAGGRPPARRV